MVTGVWQPIRKWQYVQYDIAVSVGLHLRGRLAAPQIEGKSPATAPSFALSLRHELRFG